MQPRGARSRVRVRRCRRGRVRARDQGAKRRLVRTYVVPTHPHLPLTHYPGATCTRPHAAPPGWHTGTRPYTFARARARPPARALVPHRDTAATTYGTLGRLSGGTTAPPRALTPQRVRAFCGTLAPSPATATAAQRRARVVCGGDGCRWPRCRRRRGHRPRCDTRWAMRALSCAFARALGAAVAVRGHAGHGADGHGRPLRGPPAATTARVCMHTHTRTHARAIHTLFWLRGTAFREPPGVGGGACAPHAAPA